MIALLFAAFVLPKFVQRTEPPMPEQDLAAALAAVEIDGESDLVEEEAEVTGSTESPLRHEADFSAFFEALDEEDFVASSDELVRLSSEHDTETIDLLTAEMEDAVNAMGIEEPEVAPTVVAETPSSPETEEAPFTAAPLPAEPASPSTVTSPAVAPNEVVAFFSLVQSGDFETAGDELKRLSLTADPATLSSMKAALSNAQAKEQALLASQKELKNSQEEMARLQKESVSQIQESVKQLAEVTKAAKRATAEASRLKGTLAATTEAEDAEMPEPKKSVKLPKTKSVAFGFDSTFLNEASKELLSKDVISALKDENRLTVQLRGHADAAGASDYNGILARARCEIVKDFLLEKGIDSERISMVSFGETQAAATGGAPEELRRVDVIFRPQ
ncbi:MAG: OmpA family protein [Verrucomicrobiales bacterium]|nr:OmpA family protein [Verrucomicrobiales bacterium]